MEFELKVLNITSIMCANALPVKPSAVISFDEQKTLSALVLKACWW